MIIVHNFQVRIFTHSWIQWFIRISNISCRSKLSIFLCSISFVIYSSNIWICTWFTSAEYHLISTSTWSILILIFFRAQILLWFLFYGNNCISHVKEITWNESRSVVVLINLRIHLQPRFSCRTLRIFRFHSDYKSLIAIDYLFLWGWNVTHLRQSIEI